MLLQLYVFGDGALEEEADVQLVDKGHEAAVLGYAVLHKP